MAKSTTTKTEAKTEAKNETTVETTANAKYSVDSYFESLAKGAEKMADSFAVARERNARIMDQFVESVTSGQKDFIELGRTVAGQPTDYRANTQALLDTLNRRQACALELGKTIYREQSDATSAVTERMEKLFEPMRTAGMDITAPYRKMAEYMTPAAK